MKNLQVVPPTSSLTRQSMLPANITPFITSIALTLFILLITTPSYAQDEDPPERVARLSLLEGNVSFEPAGVNQFSQAEANYPLTTGDRIYVDNNSRAELQSDALAVRMGKGADLTLTSLTDQVVQVGLAQGAIHVRSWNLQNGAVVEIDTPNGTITVVQPGDVRVDSYPQNDATVVTVYAGQAEVTGPNLSQMLGPGQPMELTGSNPIYVEAVQPAPPDDFDAFDRDRDRRQMAARAAQQEYVNPYMIGYSDLAEDGDWADQPEYGRVWYPRGVGAGWVPYHNGHWAWVAPWGWTWVEAEPWGFAPFHYGRWANFGGRWGWIPGPPIVRPVYSPALVAFVGGSGISISVGPITAWFPLGPRETYVPWYHASPGYVNRVNVTNIYNTNITEVRNVYNNRTTNIYINKTTINNITYVNRTVATTAVPQQAFAAGRPVAPVAVRVDPHQLAQAQVVPHPMVTPAQQIVTPAPARAIPANTARPVLETRAGLAPAVPGAQAHPVPVHPLTPQQQQAAKQVQPGPSHPPVAQQPPRQPGPLATAPNPAPTAQAGRGQPPVQQNTLQPVQRPLPGERPATEQANPPKPQPRPVDQPRPLINRSEPPPPQPTFVQQQRAIQQADPGRPLGPRQVENVRNGRPPGPAQQPEPIAHPPARPAPQAQKLAPPKDHSKDNNSH